MLRVISGQSNKYCDGISRRNFLQIGLGGGASVALAGMVRSQSASAAAAPKKDTSCILLWLDGGPSHIDLYDPKPDAPSEYRGMWKTIRTNVPGTFFSELIPRQAAMADKLAVIRSLRTGNTDHNESDHYLLTGYPLPNNRQGDGAQMPSFGSYVAKIRGARRDGMPAYAALPHAQSRDLRPGYMGALYLGKQYDPYEPNSSPNSADFQARNLHLIGDITLERLENRRELVRQLDRVRRTVGAWSDLGEIDDLQRQAYEMVTGDVARSAFSIGSESPQVRDRYGRNTMGQCLLLARRLVEAGTTMVKVFAGGWDHHTHLGHRLPEMSADTDQAIAALLQDLEDRGMLDRVLVASFGEMGRTPRVNSSSPPGRDHWGDAMFALLAGGGIRGGQVYGSTTRYGEEAKDKVVGVGDLHATMYQAMGVDPHLYFPHPTGRTMPIVPKGDVIRELF